jgi:hypothetical protein
MFFYDRWPAISTQLLSIGLGTQMNWAEDL